MISWTDAHCHLQDEYLATDFKSPVTLSDALTNAQRDGVSRVVVIGTDAESSAAALRVSETPSDVEIYATVGLHPHDASKSLDGVAELARRGHPRLVGIGECGLDYYYEHSPRTAQRERFAEQIALAHELDLALVIHTRDAFDDLYDILRAEGVPARTVIHCFTGNSDDARGCLDLGCDISISGVVTFKNSGELREAVKIVPLDRLHVETDSPFLAPVPHRGTANQPAMVRLVGEYVAALRGDDISVLREQTARNSARLFALPVRETSA